METRSSYFLVGLFIILLTAGSVLFGTWILGSNQGKNDVVLVVYFPGSINGLTVGSFVKYRGVQVGKVTDIALDPEHPQYVVVKTQIDPHTPLHLDTKASLQMTGITGLAFIELQGTSNTTPPLMPQKGHNYRVIYADESAFELFFEEFPKIIEKGTQVANQLLDLLSTENIKALSNSFKNVESITQNIKNHEKNINQILMETQATLESLHKHSTDSFHQFSYFLSEGRQTANSLNEFAKSMKENPSQLIYQPQYDGYEVSP